MVGEIEVSSARENFGNYMKVNFRILKSMYSGLGASLWLNVHSALAVSYFENGLSERNQK